MIMASNSSESEASDGPGPSHGCKRTRNPFERKKHSVTLLRDAGQPYTSQSTGLNVEARKIEPPCRDGCFRKLTMPVMEELFADYYGLADYAKQTAYIQSLVSSKPVKRCRVPQGQDAPVHSQTRECTVVYNNVVHKVCKAAFLPIFGMRDKRMCTALAKVSITGCPVPDKYGKHTPGTKKGERVHQLIHEHVSSIPKVSSHYTRAKSP